MKINAIARKAIADKLASAIRREGLTHKEAAELFNMKSDRVSKFLNDKHRDFISDEYVEQFREWSNSGDSLRFWAKKHNPTAAVHSANPGSAHQPEVDNTNEPPKKEELDKNNPIVEFLTEIYDDHTINGSHRIKARQLLESIQNQSNKADWGASIDEIRELLYDWGKSLNNPDVLLATIEETESKDRLDVILAVINEIKSMGFDVDISISPKG